MKTRLVLLLVAFQLISITKSYACTTFVLKLKNQIVFGRNFDFYVGFGHVIVNKRSIKKTAMIQTPEKPIDWISKYGSITFNQGGREFPYGGINEKGLVIEQMWLDETKYPEIDKRNGLSELQWIQYQLDNSATVKDVINSDTLIRISPLSTARLHFLVCDMKGNKATIEYLNGKMICHTDSTLPISVLTNHSYEESLEYIKTKANFGGEDTTIYTSGSLDRFANAASLVQNYKGENMIDYSFDILKSVSQGKMTCWSIVYDIKNLTVYFKTQKNENIREIKISDFDFSCDLSSLYVDIDSNMMNGKLLFNEYSYQKNRALIDSVCNNVNFLKSMPNEVREYSARYPETTECNK